MNKIKKLDSDNTITVRVLFRDKAERFRFENYINITGVSKGFLARQGILEKLDREEQKDTNNG